MPRWKPLALAPVLLLSLGLIATDSPKPAGARGPRTGGALSASHDEPLFEELAVDPVALAALAALDGPAPCVEGQAAGVFPCRGIDLKGYVSLESMRSGAISGSNLWGFTSLNDGREYALFGLNNGTAVVDVTDPVHPRVVGSVPGPLSPWREVKVYQFYNSAQQRYNAYAYVVSEAEGAGLQILNLNELPREVSLEGTYRGFDTAHTITLANVDPSTMAANSSVVKPTLYIQGFDRVTQRNSAGILALDISDPVSPVLLGKYTRSYAHDTWAGLLTGERARVCPSGSDPCELVVNWAGDAIRIIDFSDKSAPAIISETVYPGLQYAHSGWISKNGDYLFNMDESDERSTGQNTRVRVLDVRDWASPRVVSEWIGPTKATDHNGYTIGDKYYMSNYERGMTVLDVTDPLAPTELAFFDTFPSSDTANFHGAWGVYPYLPSGNILISNIDGAGGLFILRESAAQSVGPRAPLTPREPVLPLPPRSRLPRAAR